VGEGRYMSAHEAAAELGVSRRTLYAYVSRGLVRSESAAGGRRERRYRAEDVQRLKERAARRRDPEGAAGGALSWGVPVLESGIALISDGQLYYRGRDAVALAAGSSIEEVAAMIWTGDTEAAPGLFGSPAPEPPLGPAAARRRAGGSGAMEALQVMLPLAASEDPVAYDLRPPAVARTGARILRLMAQAVAGGEVGEMPGGVAETLRRGWALGEGAEAPLNAALVLCADHELPVSTFAARCVASARATPYAAVAAGLCAMGGVRHGGQVELVEAFLREVEGFGDAREVIAARLRRGEAVPGFGHPLYPEGDPRGAALLRWACEVRVNSTVVEAAREGEALLGEGPNLDFGLAALARALGLPDGGALVLFALGRTVGWIGHAIEQYEAGELIRPRSRYVGEPPADGGTP